MGVDVKVPDLVWDLPWSVVDMSADTPWRKTGCSLWQKEYIENGVLVWGACFYFPFSVLIRPGLVWTWTKYSLLVLFPILFFFPSPLLCKSLFFSFLPPSASPLLAIHPFSHFNFSSKKERKKIEPKQPGSWAPYELLNPCSIRFIPPLSTPVCT